MVDDTNNKTTNNHTITKKNKQQDLIMAITGGLFGSSCCIIQVIINILSSYTNLFGFDGGCLGLNKLLEPWRNPFRVISGFYFMKCWYNLLSSSDDVDDDCCRRRKPWKKLLFHTLLCLSLTMMPESIRFLSSITPSTISQQQEQEQQEQENYQQVTYRVDNMGCEGCESSVRQIIQKLNHPRIVSVDHIRYESGILKLTVERDWNNVLGDDSDEVMLDKALEHGGYDLLEENDDTNMKKREKPSFPFGDGGEF